MVTLSNTRQSHQTRYKPFDLWVAAFLILIPVFVFWYVWASYAVNVPKWDDHVLRAFLFNLDKETSVSGKLYELFRQHNEHRIVYDRIITWFDFHLFGKFNYRHLMVIGNMSLLGLIAIFGLAIGHSVTQRGLKYRPSPNLADCLVYLPPVAFLLLNLSQWENMYWGMAALQNFTVILWIVWAIYLLAFTQKIGPALLVALAATLTSGNGLLVWPIGFALLLLQLVLKDRQKRKPLIFWSLSTLISIPLYFLHYKSPPGNPPAKGSITELIGGWLAFIGSAAEALPIRPVIGNCMLFGGLILLIVLAICLYILRKWLSRRTLSPFDYFFLGTAAFLVGTGVIVAWTRAGFGINTLITSRYKLYSLLLMALVYTYIVGEIQQSAKKWILALGLLFSISLMWSSYLTYLSDTIWLRQYLLTSQFNWTHPGNSPTPSIDSTTNRYIDLSPGFYDSALATIYEPAQPPLVSLQIAKQAGGYDLQNTTTPAQGLGDAGAYIVARSSKRTYLFPVRQNQQSIRKAIIRPANLFTTGFRTSISSADLDAGSYQLFILTFSDGKANLSPTNQTIESEGPPVTTAAKNW
ncbi:hypothetical protein EXU85_13900 [Spirosoma sp. KCTC 42546]|uniref:hypothetical protein n=1 Tax=Spirosoma sp. KCTC 42546 TaxID=2520506 RepID=UPI00115A581A|nr:hypothetical protein [Spirosoma sp. KCTC 42546]QDK79637.1 hypothetical protein EXU85_13900 [Spirosoma sp. KCTC 42546]